MGQLFCQGARSFRSASEGGASVAAAEVGCVAFVPGVANAKWTLQSCPFQFQSLKFGAVWTGFIRFIPAQGAGGQRLHLAGAEFSLTNLPTKPSRDLTSFFSYFQEIMENLTPNVHGNARLL